MTDNFCILLTQIVCQWSILNRLYWAEFLASGLLSLGHMDIRLDQGSAQDAAFLDLEVLSLALATGLDVNTHCLLAVMLDGQAMGNFAQRDSIQGNGHVA